MNDDFSHQLERTFKTAGICGLKSQDICPFNSFGVWGFGPLSVPLL